MKHSNAWSYYYPTAKIFSLLVYSIQSFMVTFVQKDSRWNIAWPLDIRYRHKISIRALPWDMNIWWVEQVGYLRQWPSITLSIYLYGHCQDPMIDFLLQYLHELLFDVIGKWVRFSSASCHRYLVAAFCRMLWRILCMFANWWSVCCTKITTRCPLPKTFQYLRKI